MFDKKSKVEKTQKVKPLSSEARTFRLSIVFCITVMGLMALRAIYSNLSLSDNVGSWIFSFAVQVGVMGIVPVGLYFIMVKGSKQTFIAEFKLHTKMPSNIYALAFAIGFLMYLVNSGVSSVWAGMLAGIGYQFPNAVGTLYRTPEILIMEIITTCMLPAIFEEITDRGLLLTIFRDKSDTFKIVVIGLSFGILHQNVPQLVPAAVAGLIITFVAVKSGSIVPAMIIHFMNNFLVTITNYAEQKSDGFSNFVNTLSNYMYSSAGNLLLVVFGAAVLLAVLLKQLKFQAIGIREKIDGPGAGSKTIRISPTPSPARDLLEVYGPSVLSEEEKAQITNEIVAALESARKNDIKHALKNGGLKALKIQYEYAPFIIAIVGAMIFTIFSFVFRFRP